MAGVLARIGQETKSLAVAIKSMPFSAFGGNYGSYNGAYGGGYGNSFGYGASGMSWGLPGSQYEDAQAAGVLWENPSAAACFVALTKAFAQARPFLEKRTHADSDEWKREDHRIIELLERPNDFYSGEKMFGVTLISTMAQGAAFWRFERDRKGDISEIWYEPPMGIGATGIAPNWDGNNFIKNYVRVVDGKRAEIDREDVVYFRHGLNVANPRLPWAPLGLGAREIAVLNGASTYTAAVLRNGGAPVGFISMDGGALASATAPTFDQVQSMAGQLQDKFSGPQNAGKMSVTSLPWKFNKVGLNPSELAIDALVKMPRSIVCALLGTPPDVALLNEENPSYENLNAANRWWWDNTIIPLEDSFADEIETQMFPAFDLNPAEYRISWDRSKVPALQEDEQAKHAMLDSSYKAGWMKRSEVRHRVGLESAPDDETYISDGGGAQEDETKALSDEEIEALTDDVTPDDLQRAIASRTPAMQDLLNASDDA